MTDLGNQNLKYPETTKHNFANSGEFVQMNPNHATITKMPLESNL